MNSLSARGVATISFDGTVLDVWYPAIRTDLPVERSETQHLTETPQHLLTMVGPDPERGVARIPVHTFLKDLSLAPRDAYDVYMRLHALSLRLATPSEVNLDNAADFLSNVVWTNYGPCLVADFQMVRARLAQRGPVTVHSLGPIPPMLDYVVPAGICVEDARRVQLGAYVAQGATVSAQSFMPAGSGVLSAQALNRRLSPGEVLE